MIKYKVGNKTTNVRIWTFPDSSIGTDINIGSSDPVTLQEQVIVTVLFGDEFSINDNMFALETVMDALRLHYPISNFHLRLPYIPYARQDRICNAGEGHSLRVVARSINSLAFDTVCSVDPHSTVAEGLIERLHVSTQFDVFNKIKPSFRATFIVAPDAGAVKKCEDFAKKVGAAGVITCQKRRDLKTGKILEFKIVDAEKVLPGSDFLVLDDLCDKGGTFMAVASELLKLAPSSLELAVTHGLFTHEDGVNFLLDVYDTVYTSTSYIRTRESQKHDLLKVVDLDTGSV